MSPDPVPVLALASSLIAVALSITALRRTRRVSTVDGSVAVDVFADALLKELHDVQQVERELPVGPKDGAELLPAAHGVVSVDLSSSGLEPAQYVTGGDRSVISHGENPASTATARAGGSSPP